MSNLEDYYGDLNYFVEKQVITSSEKNLRSKMEAIMRSIESLEEKKKRIDYQIRKQKASLERKRIELKKNSKFLRQNKASIFESSSIIASFDLEDLQNYDNFLLRESNQILDD